MNKAQKKEKQEDLRFEISCRRELIRRLAYPLKQLEVASVKEHEKREARQMMLFGTYKTEDEISDAYGWDEITEEERDHLLDMLERGKAYVESTQTPVSAAYKMLREYMDRLDREARDFAFELLPEEKQAEIRNAQEHFMDEHKARMAKIREEL